MSGAVNTIYLVRHGENPANLTREFSYRRVDYSLTEKGILQAQQTAAYLRDVGVDALYASPLRRAAQTAAIIGAEVGLRVTEVEELREMNVGRLEDAPPTDESWALHDALVDEWRAGRHDVTFPGGEDYYTLLTRMRAALRQALAGRAEQHVVLVGHGGIFTLTLPAICRDLDAGDPTYWHSYNCSITEICMELVDGEPLGELVRFADCAHLTGTAARMVPARSEKE